jgi:hypothetical protein
VILLLALQLSSSEVPSLYSSSSYNEAAAMASSASPAVAGIVPATKPNESIVVSFNFFKMTVVHFKKVERSVETYLNSAEML